MSQSGQFSAVCRRRAPARGGSSKTWTRIQLGANATSYASTGLASNTRYYFRVQAFSTAGVSAYSNVANVKTRR